MKRRQPAEDRGVVVRVGVVVQGAVTPTHLPVGHRILYPLVEAKEAIERGAARLAPEGRLLDREEVRAA